jgi:hypothetical protein
MDLFGFVPPQTFSGTHYNRAVYIRLQREVDAQQKEMDEEGNRFVRRSMSPVPPDMFFRDKQAYLIECAADFERENAAIKASQHARDPVKRMSAQAMMHSVLSRRASSSLTGKERLSMLGVTPPGQFGNQPLLLAHRFSQPTPSVGDRRAVHTNAWNIQARHTPTSSTSLPPPTSRPSTKPPKGVNFKAPPSGGKSRKGHKGHKGHKGRKSRKSRKSRKI